MMNKITWSNFGEIQPYFINREDVFKFAASPTFMISHNFEYEIENTVLYIQRKGQFYGRNFCHFSFPPLTLDADYKLEKLILSDVLDYMPVILTDRDIVKFNILKREYTISHKDNEYLYKLTNYLDLVGKDWRRWRFAQHSIKRDYYTTLVTKIDNVVYNELLDFLKLWVKQNKGHKDLNSYLSNFYNGKIDGVLLMFRSEKDAEIKYYELVSKVSKNTLIMLDAKTLDKKVTFCFNKASLSILAHYFLSWNKEIYFNAGISISANNAISKQLYKHELLKIYRVEMR